MIATIAIVLGWLVLAWFLLNAVCLVIVAAVAADHYWRERLTAFLNESAASARLRDTDGAEAAFARIRRVF